MAEYVLINGRLVKKQSVEDIAPIKVGSLRYLPSVTISPGHDQASKKGTEKQSTTGSKVNSKYALDQTALVEDIISGKVSAGDYADLLTPESKTRILEATKNKVQKGGFTAPVRTDYEGLTEKEKQFAENLLAPLPAGSRATFQHTNKKAQEKKAAGMKVDPGPVENAWDVVSNSVLAGLNTFNQGLTATADVILGKPLQALGWENNPISQINNYYKSQQAHYSAKAAQAVEESGNKTAGKIVSTLTEGASGALPYTILSLLTMGGSSAATTSTLTANAASQGANLLTKAGLTVETMARNPQFWLSWASTYGNDFEEAKAHGANDTTAALAAMTTSLVNAGIEIGPDGASGIQGLPDEVMDGGKPLLEWALSSIEEGGEEVLQGVVSNAVAKVAYDNERDIAPIKEMATNFGMGTAVGALLGGGQVLGVKSQQTIQEHAQRREAAKLTENEQKVVDKLVADRIAEAKGKGEALTKREAEKQVRNELEKGYISTDTIEEVLGGESYKRYKDTSDKLDTLQAEYDKLYKMKNGDKSDEQIDRQAELKKQLEEMKRTFDRTSARTKLNDEVYEKVKGDRLAESYNEMARRHQTFRADLSKYDKKQQAVIQKAIDSGILNNSNRTHEFVDLVARISADKGVLFDFVNNQKLRESGFSVDGATVNGYVTKDGVTLNIQSAKALNKVVGHEITHVLEGTEFYDALQDAVIKYAQSKGEYNSRLEAITELYKQNDPDADPVKELTADLVGDYLFSDLDFIKNLSTNHRNVFQKIYDEIKYLCKVATAGSKEARQLEKVKKAFEEAYKADSKANGDAKYSLSEIVDKNNKSYGIGVHLDSTLLDNLTPTERLGMVKEYVKELGGESFTAYDNNGNAVDVTIAKSNARFKNQRGKRTLVNKDLTTKHIGNEVKQEAIALIDELIVTAEYDGSKAPQYPHGWIDNNGRNDWEYWTTYVQDKNNTIWEATLNIANTANGEKILYDISPIKKVGQSVKSDTIPTTESLSQESPVVNAKFSLSDSTGRQLSKEQQEYFKDSKVRDASGNLLVMYHGTQKGGFNVFNPNYSDDGISLFFSDRSEVAASYSGSSETYSPQYFKTVDDINRFLKKADDDGTRVIKRDGEYVLQLPDGYIVAKSETLQGIYEEYCNWAVVGPGDVNYKVYLNIKNPFVVDANGQEWNNLTHYEDLPEALKSFYPDGLWRRGTTRDVAKYAKGQGHDGVIFKNILDNGIFAHSYIGPSTVAVVFEPNQIKSVANANPSADPDIRYSLSEQKDSSKAIAPIRSDIYGKDIELIEKIGAPIREDNVPVAEDEQDDWLDQVDSITDEDAPPVRNMAPGKEISTVAEKIKQKIKNTAAELEKNRQFRDQAIKDYDEEIARAQAELDSKKNKESKVAQNLRRRIERLNRLRDDINADYSKRISDLEARLEKLHSQEYQRSEHRRAKQEAHTRIWEDLIGDTSTWKDMALGLSYKTKTLRRILRKVVKDANGNPDIAKADAIYDELETKYDHNEALLKKESRRLKEAFFEYHLNKTEDTYAHMLGELRHNPDTTLTEDVVKEYYNEHKKRIDTQKVDKAIEESRKTFDDLIVRVNEVLKEQGFKEIPYRQGYFPHFTNPKQGWLAKALNWKTIDSEIPTSIAGLTEAFEPQRSWQSFDKQRKSDETDYSLYQGLDAYIHGALDWIYHIEDLQKRRALENWIRYTHSDEGVKERIDKIKADETLDAEEAQQQIDGVYAEAKNPLGNLVRELRNRTNTLANKKSSMDREMEEDFNRKVYSTMTNINSRINANAVVGSLSSALTNFIPITQSWLEVSPVFTARGMGDLVKSTIKDDGLVAKSDFLTNRLLEEEDLYQTGWDKVIDKAGFMMNVVDNITSQTVWRSKYLQNLHEGMSENQAIKNADQFAKNLMAGRSRGNQPTVFDAKNPFTKLFTAFQLEVANQYGYMFEDAPQDAKNKLRLVKGYATAFLGAYLYNALFSTLTGRDAAFDPIGIIEDFMRDLGMFGDDDEEEKEQAFLNLGENILQEVPFVGGYLGGGRIPISSALPYGNDSSPINSLMSDVERGWNEGNWTGLVKEMLKPLYYVALPAGGGQIKKSAEGLGMFLGDHPIAGSYTDSGALRFPVDENLGSVVQAGLFGQYASKNAREYFDNGYAPLEEKQIQEYIDTGMEIEDYWEFREGLKDLDTLEQKANYVNSWFNLRDDQKNILINNISGRKDKIDMSSYGDYGSFEEFDFATKNPEKYTVAKSVGGYDVYKTYSDRLNGIKADKDENGKTISGSRKDKVIDYINGLDADYGAKIILYKSEYPSDDTYNYDIVDYLNSRDDISYSEMETILKELGFIVDAEGNITWD